MTLKHILQVIRCLLIVPFPESSLNDEAGKMFMDSYDEFSARAKLMTKVHAIPCSSSGKSNTTDSDKSCVKGSASQDVVNKKEATKKKDAKKKGLKRL